MEFGLQLTDAVSAALGGGSHDSQLGGETLVFEAAVGRQEGVHLAQRVSQDVRVAVTAADQAGDGVDPADRPFFWPFRLCARSPTFGATRRTKKSAFTSNTAAASVIASSSAKASTQSRG